MVCRLCHAKLKCTAGEHLYAEKGPCEICSLSVDCVRCVGGRVWEARQELIRIYRNTRTVSYGGGFIE